MAEAPVAVKGRTRFEDATPILRVTHLRASVDFYQTTLGFRQDWGGDATTPAMASVSRDGAAVILCEGAQGVPGTWVWFGVEDVMTLHAEYAARGAKVVLPPTNFSWAMEMRVQDPDGHVLRFGSEPLAGQPFDDSAA